MGLAPWGVIGQGKWMSKEQLAQRKESGEAVRGVQGSDGLAEKDAKMSEALEKVAEEIGDGATVTSVAIAWAILKTPYVFPISKSVHSSVSYSEADMTTVGGRKISHLHANIKALSHRLTAEQTARLEAIYPFDIGFPMNFFGADSHLTGKTQNVIVGGSAKVQWVKAEEAISPA